MGSIRIKKIYARRGEEDRVFSSVAEAAEFVNGIKHMVYKCCEGKKRYHHGWQFSYTPFEPIDKACEWIQCVALDYMQGDITDVKWGAMLADFRKDMEE